MTAPTASAARHDLDPRLLEVLVCPVTRAPLFYDRARGELISNAAKLAYPIRDGRADHAARGSPRPGRLEPVERGSEPTGRGWLRWMCSVG